MKSVKQLAWSKKLSNTLSLWSGSALGRKRRQYFFPIWPRFLPFSPTAEPSPRPKYIPTAITKAPETKTTGNQWTKRTSFNKRQRLYMIIIYSWSRKFLCHFCTDLIIAEISNRGKNEPFWMKRYSFHHKPNGFKALKYQRRLCGCKSIIRNRIWPNNS